MQVSAQIQIDPQRPDASGSLYYRNKQGLTYATIGAGEIVVRADPNASLIALNRDAANVQRTTKNDVINIEIPAVNLKAIIEDITNTANFVSALAANIPEEVRNQGRQASDLYLDAIARGITEGELRAFITSPEFIKQLALRNQWDIDRLKGGDPKKLADAAFYIDMGEKVFWDEASNTYRIETNCGGIFGPAPCSIPVDQLQKFSKADLQKLLDHTLSILLSKGDFEASKGTLPEGLRGIKNTTDALMCAVTWSVATGDASVFIAASQALNDPGKTNGYSKLMTEIAYQGIDVLRVQAFLSAQSNDLNVIRKLRDAYAATTKELIGQGFVLNYDSPQPVFSQVEGVVAYLNKIIELREQGASAETLKAAHLAALPELEVLPFARDEVTKARIAGAIGVIGSSIEVALGGIGAVFDPEPLTKALAVIMVAHGADAAQASWRTLVNGRPVESFAIKGLEAAFVTGGMSEENARFAAGWADLGISLGLNTVAAFRLSRGLRAETYYRVMTEADYKALTSTGRIPATGETFISPSAAYASKYEGVMVEFKLYPGTTDKLLAVGVRDQAKKTGHGTTYGGMSLAVYFQEVVHTIR